MTRTVTITPEPKVAWYRDDELIDSSGRYKSTKDNAATYSLNVDKLEIVDQVSLTTIYKIPLHFELKCFRLSGNA